MMEAIAAFSLACNVIQVVDLGIKLAEGYRQICNTGSTQDNARLEEEASSIKSLCGSLGATLHSVPRYVPPDEEELRILTTQTLDTADKLLEVLQDLKPKKPRKGLSMAGWSLKAMMKKREIETLQRELLSYQNRLELGTLIRINQKFDASNFKTTRQFASLDAKMQNIITAISNGNTKFRELVVEDGDATRKLLVKTVHDSAAASQAATDAGFAQAHEFQLAQGADTHSLIVDKSAEIQNSQQIEGELTRSHITREISHLQVQEQDGNHRQRVLDSLFFSDMHVRQERIKPAHRKTFQWIFDTLDGRLGQDNNFAEWLKSGHGIYWNCGKPGSGKSTLMNFIYEDARTQKALAVWADTYQLIMPSFFFWNAGSHLQKTSMGLLRSLLYQVLVRLSELPPSLAYEEMPRLPTWTEKRLLSTLDQVIEHTLDTHRLCFFIDGLDEFEGDLREVIDLVKQLNGNLNVKLCVSSRPELLLRLAFSETKQLNLEDLTRGDIMKYVKERLRPVGITQLEQALVRKAEGVFLWVTLAVEDILNGSSEGEDGSELSARLVKLPQEIGALYQHMLQDVSDAHTSETRLFFSLLLFREPKYKVDISLLDFALATYGGLDRCLATDLGTEDLAKILSLCERMFARVRTRCRGLLEVNETQNKHPETKAQDENEQNAKIRAIHRFSRSKVSFLHLTVKDFLLRDERGRNLAIAGAENEARAKTMLMKVQLAKWHLDVKSRNSRWTKSEAAKFAGELNIFTRQARKVYVLSTDCLLVLMSTVAKFIDTTIAKCIQDDTDDFPSQQAWKLFVDTNTITGTRLWEITKSAVTLAGSFGQASLPVFCLAGLFGYVLQTLDQSDAICNEVASSILYCTVVSIPVYGLSERRERLLLRMYELGANGDHSFETPLGAVTAEELLLQRAAIACLNASKTVRNDDLNQWRFARMYNTRDSRALQLDKPVEVELLVRDDREGQPSLCAWHKHDLYVNKDLSESPRMTIAIPPTQILQMLSTSTPSQFKAHVPDSSTWDVVECRLVDREELSSDPMASDLHKASLKAGLISWLASQGGSVEEQALCGQIIWIAVMTSDDVWRHTVSNIRRAHYLGN